MTKENSAQTIAEDFNQSYERAWNAGINQLLDLYAEESILVGYSTVQGKTGIAELLSGIIDQGWSRISIKTTHAKFEGQVVLVVNEYTAIGTGEKAGETLNARSSHVLSKVGDKWLTVMHSAM
ncbi:protein of unknown function [Mucilaginibacter gossypiicola]|uniref:DUF4440 domain-containing protein n=1 Tax=Mucilaginibacter gossypiicola TaxID=551995 RepID=A0A1H8D0B9_9SPHI|nr:nuclear transport factor 2 family protein [Mucilaginibacter gossypiicola]SEN00871.1 protein of unknown function [Mucilaginibacter gossypiicola]